MTRFLLDVNVLLALSLPTHQHHVTATQWFDPGRPWATTPITETAYLRLLSNPRVVGYDIPPAQALAALRTIRALAGHLFVPDEASLAEPAIDLAPLAGTRQVTDFHLVNLAAANGLLLATLDGSLVRCVSAPDRRHLHVVGA